MIINADARHIPLADESVQCVVTSPPYWRLRSYGIGADNGELGCERTPEEYVAHMVAVFREVRRVLRADGTLWLNIGDSYAGSNCGSNDYREKTGLGTAPTTKYKGQKPGLPDGLKPKDLVGIPWRVAFALQADGWWLRSDIIWAKPNPMPESVKDRCTRSHEYVFMLTKSARYYYDAQAIAEPSQVSEKWHEPDAKYLSKTSGNGETSLRSGFNRLGEIGGTRNRRDVWSITTKPFKGAHFATMPPDLAEICIRAGTSQRGCCPKCGAPWERIIAKTGEVDTTAKGSRFDKGKTAVNGMGRVQEGERYVSRTIGWRPTCTCDAGEPVPCVVLDPFVGSGTTALVAERLGRECIGLDLSEKYLSEIAAPRLAKVQPALTLVDRMTGYDGR